MQGIKKYLMVILFVTYVVMGSQAWAERLFSTTSTGNSTSSDLLEIDPATGALISTIGSVGYSVIGLSYDATSSTLYGVTARQDPNFSNGLISIDINTGAGTPIGPGGQGVALGDEVVTRIAANSSGQLYSWLESGSDDLVIWDKTAGTATIVGTSGLDTFEFGMAFDNSDTLYFINGEDAAGGPNVHQINTTTGTETPLLGVITGTTNDLAKHGDFNPVSNLYFGLDASRSDGSIRNLLIIDATTQALVNTIPTVDDLNVLAFVSNAIPPSATPENIPIFSPLGFIVIISGLLWFGRRGKKIILK